MDEKDRACSVHNNSHQKVDGRTSTHSALWLRLCPSATQAPILTGMNSLPRARFPQLHQHSFPHDLDSLTSTVVGSPSMPVIGC